MTVPSCYTFVSDCATESDLRDLKNELQIMDSVGHHPNLVNLIGACSSAGESALKLELNRLGFAGATLSTPRFWGGEIEALLDRVRICITRGEV